MKTMLLGDKEGPGLVLPCHRLHVLLGMIPFFVGDIIDIFHRANTKNMAMIQGFVDGDETIIKEVNQKAWQSAIVLIVLLLLIALIIWALISFGSYLYSLVASVF